MRPKIGPRAAGDLTVGLAIVLFAVLALQLHDALSGLGDMASGIRETGRSLERTGREAGTGLRTGFADVASSVEDLPIVGADAARRLREAGDATAEALERETRASGQELARAGRDGERSSRSAASALGWLAFLVPSVLLLALWLPNRRRIGSA